MSKEKQIEEMAKAICEHYVNGGCGRCTYCFCDGDALKLYNAGYRKQSEGEWEKVMHHRECSKCHYRAPYKKIKNGYFLQDLTAYCPNCGAKMKGGAE
jgi:hypothetical protein